MIDQPTTEDPRMSELTDVYVLVGTDQPGGVQTRHRLIRTADLPKLWAVLDELRAR